jgi:hypothetical protein
MGIDCRSWSETIPTCACPDRPTRKSRIGKIYKVFALWLISTNIIKTGDDTETLRILEARIQAEFKKGLPPHLQPDAGNLAYVPGSDQSRIFVAPHSEFKSMDDRVIQRILRNRIILVHGVQQDYAYKWDLKSMGRVYDVDKKVTVHGGIFTPCVQDVFSKTSLSVQLT